MQVLIFLIVVCALNIALLKTVNSYSNAFYTSAIISITATIAFQLIAYILQGYIDPFIIIAISIQIVIALISGFLINCIILKFKRRLSANNNGATPK